MYKILIVEDDETIAGGLKNHLEKWNYQAECMTDFKDVMGKFVERQMSWSGTVRS